MKKFKTVIIVIFVLAIASIIYLCSVDSVYLEEFREVDGPDQRSGPAFPVTEEQWPDDLDWQDGSAQATFASATATKGGVWNRAIASFPATFRQVGPDSNGSFRGELDINDMELVGVHPDTRDPIPGLARAWAVGKDKRTVYFKIDPDAKWDDGQPVVADDFICRMKMMRAPGIVAPWYNQYYSSMVEDVLKFGPHRIAVRLPQPMADIVIKTALSPLPYHYYGRLRTVKKKYPIAVAMSYLKRDGKDIPTPIRKLQEEFAAKEADALAAKRDPPESPTVEIEVEDVEPDWVRKHNWKIQPRTGPYNISSFIKGKQIVLKRNEHWWAKDKKYFRNRYNVDRIRYTVIRDNHIQFEHFLKGDLDQFGLILPNYWHSKAKYLEAVDKGYMIKIWFYTDMPQPSLQVSFNLDVPLLANTDVRMGIIYALNLQLMIDTVLRGDYVRSETFAEGYGKYTNDKIKARRFDLQKSIAHLEAAGFATVGRDGVRVNAKGGRLSFKFLYAHAVHTERLIILVNEAKRAGVELVLDQFDSTAVFKAMLNNEHEIAWHGWSEMFRPQYRGSFHKDNAHKNKRNNLSNLDDDVISELIDRYRVAIDSEARIELAHKIEQRIFDLAPAVPTYKVPYFRQGLWRWVKYPEFMATKSSEFVMDGYGLFWIDQAEKTKIQNAMSADEIIYGNKKIIINERYRAGL